MTSDRQTTATILRDMFTAKWGFGPPAPGYKAAYERDLETVRWAYSIVGEA